MSDSVCNATEAVPVGAGNGDGKRENAILGYMEATESRTSKPLDQRKQKTKTSGELSNSTDSETISSTSVTISSDGHSGMIEAMLDNNDGSWEDEVSSKKKELSEISETDDESSSDPWNSGDVEAGDNRSIQCNKTPSRSPVNRRDSDLPLHEDPFAPRPGRTLQWQNVNMTLVSRRH